MIGFRRRGEGVSAIASSGASMSSSSVGEKGSSWAAPMSVVNGLRLVFQCMEDPALGDGANELLSEELAAVLVQLRTIHEALGRVHDLDAVHRRVRCVKREGGELDARIEELEALETSLAAVVSQCGAAGAGYGDEEQKGGDASTESVSVDGGVGNTPLVIELADEDDNEDDEDDIEVADSRVPSAADRPGRRLMVSAAEEDPATDEAQAPSMRKDIIILVDDDTDSSDNDRDNVSQALEIEVDAAAAELTAATPDLRAVTESPVSAAPNVNQENVVIDTSSVAVFTESCLKRCQELYQRATIAREELCELYGYIGRLVPLVDGSPKPTPQLTRLIQTIGVARKLSSRSKLKNPELFRIVRPVQVALLACNHSALSIHADDLTKDTLAVIFPTGFGVNRLDRLGITRMWRALELIEACRQNHDDTKKIIGSWFEYFRKAMVPLVQGRRRSRLAWQTFKPLQLFFLDLSIVVHAAIKLAPLYQARHLANTLKSFKNTYDGCDDLIQIYYRKLCASCERRAAGDTSDSESQYDLDSETKLIEEKLSWCLRLRSLAHRRENAAA